ncbi:enoyl-CoA hydratase/isomerase family protein [Jiangella mangrovi]|uniref:enoyl-CoA hydratase n=1 Tax=Jiangella mangrovi TaxID=1524084 RepID=A0A7W9LLL8_9ACTN|nr:enoyl-CoA hydratase-related protein [Jiangella mangrovi]MBB5788338.1 enoyl-CoA hydratase/carnithine racemase [Jiangella mangrovi]
MGSVTINQPDGAPGVMELVLDRPEAHNALSTDHARQIVAAVGELAADPKVRAVVLSSSSPKAFCVGADLKERNDIDDDGLRAQRVVFRAMFTGLLELPVPTVAAVHGYALGGGLELALSCDLIVLEETAVVGLPEVSVGVIPGGGGTQLLTRRLGWSRAADLIFTARRLDAAEAYRLGLADRLVPAGAGAARAAALELATTIAGHSPVGVHNAKRAMRQGFDAPLAAGLDIEDAAWRATAFSGDRKEGVAAFNEKRRPDWPGE